MYPPTDFSLLKIRGYNTHMSTITVQAECKGITTAPKDRMILLWDRNRKAWIKGGWAYEGTLKDWYWFDVETFYTLDPSHWTELDAFNLS